MILIAHKKRINRTFAASKKHEQSLKNRNIVLPIDKFAKMSLLQKQKTTELKIAVYVAYHFSFISY